MSSFTAVGTIMALGLANVFIYHLIDDWMQDRSDAIITGTVRGTPVSVDYRRWQIYTRWLQPVAMQVGWQTFWSIGLVLLARNTGAEEVRLFAYLGAFLSANSALAWLVLAPFAYVRLLSVLRQVEAD